MTSARPLPVMSPTPKFSHLKTLPLSDQLVAHWVTVKQVPVDRPTNQVPDRLLKAAKSPLPSPLKSPELRKSQPLVDQWVFQLAPRKAEPLDRPTRQMPSALDGLKAATSSALRNVRATLSWLAPPR